MCTPQAVSGRALNRRTFLFSSAVLVPLAFVTRVRAEETAQRSETALGDLAQKGAEKKRPISDIDPRVSEPEITDWAYLDVSVDGGPKSRLIVGLYGGIAPATVANFKGLLKDGYAGTSVYRVVPGLTVQMGDVLRNGGRSGRTANGTALTEENFRVMHSVPGMVSMAHDQNGMVDSRFFINTRPGDSGYLDGKYCAFGRVMQNMELLYEMEKAAERRGGFASRLPKTIIEECGLLPYSESFSWMKNES